MNKFTGFFWGVDFTLDPFEKSRASSYKTNSTDIRNWIKWSKEDSLTSESNSNT
jgi:hypothetical protein